MLGNANSASKVNNKLILKFDTGTTENTNLYTYDGSAAKTIDIKAGSNVSLTKAGNTITINSTNTNTTYSALSAAEAKTGTATTARTISAKVLADEINRRSDLRYLPLTGGTLSGRFNNQWGCHITIINQNSQL